MHTFSYTAHRSKRPEKRKEEEKKRAVPRAAAAYGRQLKILQKTKMYKKERFEKEAIEIIKFTEIMPNEEGLNFAICK